MGFRCVENKLKELIISTYNNSFCNKLGIEKKTSVPCYTLNLLVHLVQVRFYTKCMSIFYLLTYLKIRISLCYSTTKDFISLDAFLTHFSIQRVRLKWRPSRL